MHFSGKQFIQVVTSYVLAVFAVPQSVLAQAAGPGFGDAARPEALLAQLAG